jgi:hypothetical protein
MCKESLAVSEKRFSRPGKIIGRTSTMPSSALGHVWNMEEFPPAKGKHHNIGKFALGLSIIFL